MLDNREKKLKNILGPVFGGPFKGHIIEFGLYFVGNRILL